MMIGFYRLFLMGTLGFLSVAAAADKRPNMVVILADDLGFSDLGCYGSEIETPVLDRLAAKGVRFTQFYNTAKCHSSRVSLLTGRWCRQAGDESLARAVTIPEVLQPAGYFTMMSGKWHLSKEPTDFGFQRYFGHLSGACSFYKGDKTFRLNGEPWEVPTEGFYTTVAKVDFALRFLQEARAEQKPWLLYLAFNAPHAPLQPLEADYKKYLGRYDVGWDVIRSARQQKQNELALFGDPVTAAPRPDHIPAWESLPPEIKDWEARRMAAYAGMIDRVDQEIGRLVADLEANGELENTMILFLSDNGACPYDRNNHRMNEQPYDGETSWSDSTGWAWARNAPFRYYKQNQFEGGIATPGILHWPAGLKLEAGSTRHEPLHLVDLMPTLAELAAAELPTAFPGRELTPLAGQSFAPLLRGEPMGERPPLHFLFSKDRALRVGDWKLVSFQSEPWELYNLARDRTEQVNLAEKHPRRVKQMAAQWHDMAANVLMATKNEQAPVAAEASGEGHKEWSVYSGANGADTSSRVGRPVRSNKVTPVAQGLRSRVDTKLQIKNAVLYLQSTGDDPGLAFDRLPQITEPGPYILSFEMLSSAKGEGEVFFTTDPKTRLPNGQRVTFDPLHDGNWHSHQLTLDTQEPIVGLRLDPCSSPGDVTIRNLSLSTKDGKILVTWPQQPQSPAVK
jgi:arylsulfatase A-like enzyme